MKNHFLWITLILLISLNACKSLQEKANDQFLSGQYQYAISSYSQILEDDPDNQEANLAVAESYRLSNRIEEAGPYYEKLVEDDPSFENLYRLGLSLKAQQKDEEAKEAFEKAKGYTQNEDYLAETQRQIEAINLAAGIENYFPNHVLVNYKELNTPGADYAPVSSENFIYFTSGRRASGLYPADGSPYTKLFRTRAEGLRVDVSNIQTLPEFQNEEGLNQAAIAISPDGNTIIYARGNSTSPKDLPETALFASYFRGSGFTQPIWMPVNEDETWWNSTPAFSPDGEELYFASNRPGGYGGVDLYKATRLANGDFGNAVNLGPNVNTPGNELFPRPTADGKFFFSSDGHPGYGKLDLFVAEKDASGKQVIKNLGENFNSSNDDFAIFFTEYPKEGFISSNREGGEGDDDIYFFEDKTPKPKIVNVLLNVYTKQRVAGEPDAVLEQARVVLYDSENKQEGGDFSNSNGRVRFTLEPNADFTIIASKTGYFSKSIPYTTVGKTPNPEDLIQEVTNITLDTTIVLDQLILEKSIVLENIYYDLDKADIRPDAAVELDKLVQILKDNPSIRIELSSHTDDRSSDEYNQDLSQRRAQSAVDYIVSQGISADRLVAKGYGESQLIIKNAQTEEEHQVNRRTEFKVIEIRE
ncbi:outer membrane protein OmpA-like peptidoglycan-associated protein [Algoriphagus iocasae]|uniref:Outer membrane protein OmpA-like peptidoglycan-associated protein n=1 Tax=Algoriphagus iocasae TaxID=1836499 RepID=A0A841MVU7_9BACT|nr:OmpA family protein [Algoriphagus iocasae]MBB6326121.1 outer membrane protein OmpA-like peptidoglycan-associated protein [Algoriphagus iocasae]